MKFLQHTSSGSLIAKFKRDYKRVAADLEEDDAIEWIAEAMSTLNMVQNLEEAVCFAEVKDHRIQLPSNINSIIQVARNNSWCPEWNDNNRTDAIRDTLTSGNCNPKEKDILLKELESYLCPNKIEEVVQEVSTEETKSCYTFLDESVKLNCHGDLPEDFNVAYYRPFYDLRYQYEGWTNSSYYKGNYSPVVLGSHSFFSSFVCQTEHDNKQNRIVNYDGCDQYTVDPPYLTFNFRQGSVAVAYLRTRLAEDGTPLIPDDYSFRQAITSFILMKMMGDDFYSGDEGSGQRYSKAERDWQWYCAQAKAKNKMISGKDEYQALLNQSNYMLPDLDRHSNFFGNLYSPEHRVWNNTQSGRRHGY